MRLFPTLVRFRSARPGQSSGFTMIEIALSLAVIGFALVAIVGVLPVGMSVQKDNREETIVTLDAAYLMDALRTGARGQDNLTNHVIGITNYSYLYGATTNLISKNVAFYTPLRYSLGTAPIQSDYLTNGQNIIGLMTLPKYQYNSDGSFVSNYTTVDMRAINSSAIDQGTNQAARDFAFNYRVDIEVNPFNQFDPNWVTTNVAAVADLTYLRANLSQIRLRYRWPILPNGKDLGTGRQTFRTSQGGQVVRVAGGAKQTPDKYFIQPQIYSGVQ
jgi:type II secretory pathway pseudopilin PulG